MPAYIKFDGIDGEVVAEAFAGAFNVHSYEWGVSNSGTTGGGGGGAGKATFSDLSLTMTAGKGSPFLAHACASGKHIKTAKLTAVRTGRGRPETTLEVQLEDILVSSYQMNGESNGRPGELVTLNFAKITYTQYFLDGENTRKKQTFTWDLKTGKGGVQ